MIFVNPPSPARHFRHSSAFLRGERARSELYPLARELAIFVKDGNQTDHTFSMQSQQAKRVIERFGGIRALAEAVGKRPETIYRWTYPRERQGTDGVVPSSAWRGIRKAAARLGITLSNEDFMP